jgi:hypothetical protein
MLSREQVAAGARSLVLPVAIALILDALFYTGYLASDDNGYLSTAYRVVHGQSMTAYVGSVRAGMSIPVIVLYALAGGRVHLIATAFALLHPLLVVLVHCIGRLAHGDAVARMAALLIAICPFLYLYAGAILPDLLMSAALALSLIATLIALSARRPMVWSLLAGIALGLGYTVKETALVMVVPAIASLAVGLGRHRARAIASFSLGLAAVLLLETVTLRILCGEWITHLGMIASADTQSHIAEVAAAQGVGPFRRFHTAFMELKLIGPLWIWMLVVGSVAYVRLEDRSVPVLLFTAWAFAYLTWGTTSFTSYSPPPIQPRYYAMAFVPAVVVVARVLLMLSRPVASSPAKVALFSLLIAALSIGELSRNRGRAGNIYGAWIARGAEEAYLSASRARPELEVVLSPEYAGSLDGMFLEDPPPNLISLYGWEPKRRPEPPFYFIELGDRWREAKLSALAARPVDITTHDIIYPRPRLERLWEGIRGFFVVGPEPPRGTWYWHTHETLLLLVEPSRDRSSERIIGSAPLYPDPSMKMRRTPRGHVLTWPAGLTLGRAQYFDQRGTDVPPTHDGSALDGTSRRLCVEVDYDALAGSAQLTSELDAYELDGRRTTSSRAIRLVESSSATVSLKAKSERALFAFRVSVELSQLQGAGSLLVGPPRITPCE